MNRLGIIPQEPARWPRILGLTLFGVLSALACMRYLALRSTVFDLGIYVSTLTAISTSAQWWQALSGHIQPVLWGYAWLIRPLPEWLEPLGLVVAQAFMLSLPLPALARRYGILPAMAYFLSFAVWRNGLFDFHPEHLAVPLGIWFFLCAEDERFWTAALAALCLCLIKETFALQAAACGLYLMFCRGGVLPGMTAFFLGLGWFWLATAKLIPFFALEAQAAAAGQAFAWLGGTSVMGKMWFVFTHPQAVVERVFGNPEKLRYLVALFGSLAFLPFLKPGPLIVALPPLVLSLLSTRAEHASLTNHSTAGLIAPLIMSFTLALPVARGYILRKNWRLDRWAVLLALPLLASHIFLSASPLSLPFWRDGGPGAYWPGERDTRIIRAMETLLPADAAQAVVTQNSLHWGKAAHRNFTTSFPLAVFEPQRSQNSGAATLRDFRRFLWTGEKPPFPVTENMAEYLVLDLKRPWFVGETRCAWSDGACRDSAVPQAFLEALERTRPLYDTLHEEDGFMVLKRKHPEPETPHGL